MTTTDRPTKAQEQKAPEQQESPAEAVLHAALKLPELTARLLAGPTKAAAETLRHPERLLPIVQRLPLVRQAVAPILTGRVDDWAAEYAYTTGVQAFVYGFPYIYNAQLRHDWVTDPRDPARVPYAAVNQFWHARQLLAEPYAYPFVSAQSWSGDSTFDPVPVGFDTMVASCPLPEESFAVEPPVSSNA